MAKAVTRTWYRVALARPDAPTQLVAASGEHMGQAIAEARDHVAGSWPIAVDNAEGKDIPLGESVGRGHVLMLGDAPGDRTTFQWPVGVLPSLAADAASFTGAGAGWTYRPDKNNLLVIEAQTPGPRLVETFFGLVEKLPSGDNLEIRVLDHFEDAGATDIWLTSRTNTKKIIHFLDDHDELFGNGGVEVSVYVRSLKATIRLTEHKTIVWIADGRALEREMADWLKEAGVPKVSSLVTVREGAHFHYRPAKSRDRKKLGDELYKQRLRKVDTVKRTA